MGSRRYDEDSDSGDISLSIPSSRSSPHLSATLQGLTSSSSNGHSRSPSLGPQAGPSRYREISSPTPKQLLGKSLWPRNEDAIPRASSSTAMRSNSTDPKVGHDVFGPKPVTRRTSSQTTVTINRSRSLQVRIPEIDSPDSNSFGTGARTPSMRVGWSRRPGEARPPPIVSPKVADRMGRWVKEIVVCNFDLERGPVVERRIIGRRWGPGEKQNVAFSSFPDTSLFAEGDIQFSFKIRHIPPDLSVPEPPSPMPESAGTTEQALLDQSLRNAATEKGGSKAEEYRQWDERGREWLYGYVWFEQRRDGGIARGYMQKSLVILSHLPFPALFAAILDKLAPVFFEHGYSALEAACHGIASWPDPIPDAVLELPLLSEVVTVKLPDTSDTHQVNLAPPSSAVPRPLLASLPSSSPLRTFATILPSLWSLWECLILAEPVLVIAPDPRTCSEIVWWLRDLLRPIPPAGDFRPYLHIHDHDFSLLVNSNKPQPGLVVGVTNPFFRNAASHWPNVISIASDKPGRIVNGAQTKNEEPEGFISRRHRSVQKDRVLLKRLEALVSEGNFDDVAGNQALRTHFQQLTEKMLVPLNRYFQTLVPTLSPTPSASTLNLSTSPSPTLLSSSPLTSLRAFSLPSFLNHLRTRGPNPLSFRTRGLTSRTRVESDFYASFCMSPTFAGWLSSRVDSLGSAVRVNEERINNQFLSVTPDRRGGGGVGGGGGGEAFLEFGMRGLGISGGPRRGDGEGDENSLRRGSPTQWSSGISESGEGLRMSSDGSSAGHRAI